MAWQDELLPASWRGVPFGVETAGIKPGRKVAVHDYPYKDGVWAEDVGGARHPFSFTGFLVEGDLFAGGLGVFVQRDLMVAACLAKGPGLLVHPSLGARTVVLLDGGEMTERADKGGAIELQFTFVESLPGPEYPDSSAAAGQTASAAGTLNGAASGDFGSGVLSAVSTGANAVGQAVTTVSGFVAQAATVMQTATRAIGAVTALAGVTGRYASGNRSVLQGAGATVGTALAAATAARTAVTVAGSAARSLAAAL